MDASNKRFATDFLKLIQYNHFFKLLRFLLFIATQKINKHTDQLISVNALGLAHKFIQFYAIKFVQK